MVIELAGMAPSGEAVGRHEGLVVFARYGLPGERVDMEITQRRRAFARGEVIRVLRPSAARVEPRCPHFGACGGCDWQQAAYTAQLAYKTGIVREQLARIGNIDHADVWPCIAGADEYGYRNHTQFVMAPDGRLGYHRAGSHAIIPVPQCPIIDPALNQLLAEVNAADRGAIPQLRELHLRCSAAPRRRMLVFEQDRLDLQPVQEWINRAPLPADVSLAVIAGSETAVLRGPATLRERVGEHAYELSPASFFQVNTGVAALLVREVSRALSLRGDESVLDLYCGVGLFTLPIGLQASRVMGVEANAGAVRDAQGNLKGFEHVEVMRAEVGAALASQKVRSRRWDALVVDPPRAGIERRTLEGMIDLRAPRVVYVSCDPATLARDARVLRERGYRLVRAQPLDMFPQTRHVETVAVFETRRGRPARPSSA